MSGSWSNVSADLIVLQEDQSGYSGLFGYSPSPAAGSLVFSVAAVAGTDPYGNPYLAGSCSYVYDQAYTQINAGIVYVGPMTNATPDTAYAAAMGQSASGGLSLAGSIKKGLQISLNRAAMLLLQAGAANATVPTGIEPYVGFADPSGSSVVSGRISGALEKTSVSGTVLGWQTPALGSGWVTGPQGGSYRGLQYRLDCEDNLIVSGVCHTTSATPSATLFTLPAGYIPAAGERPGITYNKGGAYSTGSLEIATSGAATVDPVPAASATDAYIYATVPMGHQP